MYEEILIKYRHNVSFGGSSMAITEFAKEYHERMFPGYESDFLRTDPEFIERFATASYFYGPLKPQ